jgi:hypothetical protein
VTTKKESAVRQIITIFVFFFASSLTAQPLTVGVQTPDQGGTTTISSGGPVTYVNLANFATASGTVNKASVSWSASCSNAFKIVFLRNSFQTLQAFDVVATRGPFNAVSGRNDVTLSPPVTLAIGDLIGVVQLQSFSACGSVELQSYPDGISGSTLVTTADMSLGGTIGSTSGYPSGLAIGAVAYNNDPLLVRILPAAGAVQGATAFFRTSLQLLNPTFTTITGKLVFHKQGQSASASDPSLPFTLGTQKSISYSDVITTLGSSGLGSLDVVTNGGAIPIASARVFSDGGSAGTSGFSEEGISPNAAIDQFSRGVLLIPSDLTNFRMNIGIRTLDTGATLSIYMFDAGGTLRSTRSGVIYSPNFFDQVPLNTFTGSSTPQAGGWILVTMSSGRAILYGSVIDGRTSDSTFRLADIK